MFDGKPMPDVTLGEFIEKLASASPTPGGGSVAALNGAVGAALASMVCNLTVNKKGYEEHWQKMEELAGFFKGEGLNVLDLVKRDMAAFDGFMSALRLPKDTPEQQQERKDALAKAAEEAAQAPLDIAIRTCGLLCKMEYVAECGNKTALSDAAIAATLLKDATIAALHNVTVNLPYIKDEGLKSDLQSKVEQMKKTVEEKEKIILEKVKL